MQSLYSSHALGTYVWQSVDVCVYVCVYVCMCTCTLYGVKCVKWETLFLFFEYLLCAGS